MADQAAMMHRMRMMRAGGAPREDEAPEPVAEEVTAPDEEPDGVTYVDMDLSDILPLRTGVASHGTGADGPARGGVAADEEPPPPAFDSDSDSDNDGAEDDFAAPPPPPPPPLPPQEQEEYGSETDGSYDGGALDSPMYGDSDDDAQYAAALADIGREDSVISSSDDSSGSDDAYDDAVAGDADFDSGVRGPTVQYDESVPDAVLALHLAENGGQLVPRPRADVVRLFEAVAAGSLGELLQLDSESMVKFDMDAVDADGRTPLMIAASSGHARVADFLCSRGATVDARGGGERSTALMMAASAGHMPLVRLLLACGAEPDMADAGGRTALMHAAACGSAQCVDELLMGGADGRVSDSRGASALAIARSAERRDGVSRVQLCNALVAAGAYEAAGGAAGDAGDRSDDEESGDWLPPLPAAAARPKVPQHGTVDKHVSGDRGSGFILIENWSSDEDEDEDDGRDNAAGSQQPRDFAVSHGSGVLHAASSSSSDDEAEAAAAAEQPPRAEAETEAEAKTEAETEAEAEVAAEDEAPQRAEAAVEAPSSGREEDADEPESSDGEDVEDDGPPPLVEQQAKRPPVSDDLPFVADGVDPAAIAAASIGAAAAATAAAAVASPRAAEPEAGPEDIEEPLEFISLDGVLDTVEEVPEPSANPHNKEPEAAEEEEAAPQAAEPAAAPAPAADGREAEAPPASATLSELERDADEWQPPFDFDAFMARTDVTPGDAALFRRALGGERPSRGDMEHLSLEILLAMGVRPLTASRVLRGVQDALDAEAVLEAEEEEEADAGAALLPLLPASSYAPPPELDLPRVPPAARGGVPADDDSGGDDGASGGGDDKHHAPSDSGAESKHSARIEHPEKVAYDAGDDDKEEGKKPLLAKAPASSGGSYCRTCCGGDSRGSADDDGGACTIL